MKIGIECLRGVENGSKFRLEWKVDFRAIDMYLRDLMYCYIVA